MMKTLALLGTLSSLIGMQASALTLACDPATVEVNGVGAITVFVGGGSVSSASDLVGSKTSVSSSILLGTQKNYPSIQTSSVTVLKAYPSYSVKNLQYYSVKLNVPTDGVSPSNQTTWTNCILKDNVGSL